MRGFMPYMANKIALSMVPLMGLSIFLLIYLSIALTIALQMTLTRYLML